MQEHLADDTSGLKTLLLTHGTKAVLLRDILASGELALPPKPCPILGESLIFTFYGRPAYRAGTNAGALKRTASAPTFLLLKPTVIQFATHAHPLDTGAFLEDHYKNYIEVELRPTDFGFPPTLEDIKKLVRFYFGTNEAYMLNRGRAANVPHGNDEAQALSDIISSGDSGDRDGRESSIEVALGSGVPLTSDWVQCAIIPDVLSDAPDYGKSLKRLGIDVRHYNFTRGYKPDDYSVHINSIVLHYYREKKLL